MPRRISDQRSVTIADRVTAGLIVTAGSHRFFGGAHSAAAAPGAGLPPLLRLDLLCLGDWRSVSPGHPLSRGLGRCLAWTSSVSGTGALSRLDLLCLVLASRFAASALSAALHRGDTAPLLAGSLPLAPPFCSSLGHPCPLVAPCSCPFCSSRPLTRKVTERPVRLLCAGRRTVPTTQRRCGSHGRKQQSLPGCRTGGWLNMSDTG